MYTCVKCGGHAEVRIQRRMWNTTQHVGGEMNVCRHCYVRLVQLGTDAIDETAILDPRVQLQIAHAQQQESGRFIASVARLASRLLGAGEQPARHDDGDGWINR